jgi:hypothetical protein
MPSQFQHGCKGSGRQCQPRHRALSSGPNASKHTKIPDQSAFLASLFPCGRPLRRVQVSSDVSLPRRGKKAMKKFTVVLSVVIGAWISSPTPEAQAWSWSGWSSWSSWSSGGDSDGGYSRHRRHSGHEARVPELDPSAAGGAMVLLLGGVAYIASRRRKEDRV